MRTDGRTHNEVIIAFRNFANAVKTTWMQRVALCAVSGLVATKLRMVGAALLNTEWSTVNMVTVPEVEPDTPNFTGAGYNHAPSSSVGSHVLIPSSLSVLSSTKIV
jgi:hypothetical protein